MRVKNVRFSMGNLIGTLLGGILFFVCTDGARAGFILTQLNDAPTAHATTGATSSMPDEPQPSRPEFNQDLLVQAGLNSSGGSSMAGNSGTVSGGSSVPAAVLTTADDASPGELLVYLLAEPGLALPVPFLDGVFRPPKS